MAEGKPTTFRRVLPDPPESGLVRKPAEADMANGCDVSGDRPFLSSIKVISNSSHIS